MARDISNRTVAVATQVPAVVTADANGTGVDLQGFESAMVVVNTGAEGDTLSGSVKFDFILEDSDDDSTYTAVTSSTSVTEGSVDSSGIFLTLDANGETPQISQIGYIGGKRYIRCKIDATGTHSNGTPIGVVVVKGNPVDSTDA
jgi:hypothetical protein|tara:strand:+ start:1331 stop:1765 length:435 start_codon:yes stop_codon:yes gene_type:complete